MTIWVLGNEYFSVVVQTLRTICPDPAMSFDSAGRLVYPNGSRTISSVGCDAISALQKLGTIIIRGEHPDWGVLGVGTLHLLGGFTFASQYPNPKSVEIVADFTACEGKGWYTLGLNGQLIGSPLDVMLFHELSHTADMFLGTYVAGDESRAIAGENQYRGSVHLALRGSSSGGCVGGQSGGGSGGGSKATTGGTSPRQGAKAATNACSSYLLTI